MSGKVGRFTTSLHHSESKTLNGRAPGKLLYSLPPHGMPGGVRDVSWAPHSGRSHDLIASVGADAVRVHVVRPDGGAALAAASGSGASGAFTATSQTLESGSQSEVGVARRG